MRSVNTSNKLALYLSWLAGLIMVLVPFHALLTTWIGSNTGHLDAWRIWKDVLLAVVLTPGVMLLAWKSAPVREWLLTSWVSRLFALYEVLYIGMGAWAILNHRVTASALIYSLIINLRFIAFFLVCLVLASQSGFLRRNWQKIIFIPAAVILIFGLAQWLFLPADFLRHFGYGPNTIPSYQVVDVGSGLVRLQSTLRGANPLGAYLVFIIPLLIFIKRTSWRIAFGALAIFVLFYTYSRSALIGAAIAVLVFLAIKNRSILRSRLAIIIAALLLIAAATAIVGLRSSKQVQDVVLHTSKGSASSVTSNEARLNSIKSALSDIRHHPLGSGPGTAGPASYRNNNKPRIAENYFLQIGQEVGVLGMALFIAINILVARMLWRKREDDLAAALLASLVGLTFINLLSHAWADDTLAYLWWGLTGIALYPAILSSRRHKHNVQKQQSQ
jgi:hypothetical protein